MVVIKLHLPGMHSSLGVHCSGQGRRCVPVAVGGGSERLMHVEGVLTAVLCFLFPFDLLGQGAILMLSKSISRAL